MNKLLYRDFRGFETVESGPNGDHLIFKKTLKVNPLGKFEISYETGGGTLAVYHGEHLIGFREHPGIDLTYDSKIDAFARGLIQDYLTNVWEDHFAGVERQGVKQNDRYHELELDKEVNAWIADRVHYTLSITLYENFLFVYETFDDDDYTDPDIVDPGQDLLKDRKWHLVNDGRVSRVGCVTGRGWYRYASGYTIPF